MSSPRLAPWLIPETIKSGRWPTRPSSAKRTQSTGVPPVAKPRSPSPNSPSATARGERVVMLRAVALRLESGAITSTSTPSSSRRARRAACKPGAEIPSSLVSRTRTPAILGRAVEGVSPRQRRPLFASVRGDQCGDLVLLVVGEAEVADTVHQDREDHDLTAAVEAVAGKGAYAGDRARLGAAAAVGGRSLGAVGHGALLAGERQVLDELVASRACLHSLEQLDHRVGGGAVAAGQA